MSTDRLSSLDTHEVAWAAGFFDGEGCSYNQTGYLSASASVTQTDREVLARFQRAVLGLGSIGAKPKTHAHNKPLFAWRVQNWRDMQAVIALLWRFLSEPKRAQAKRVLARYHSRELKHPWRNGNKRIAKCRFGHEMADAYVQIRNGRDARECRVCRAERRRSPDYVASDLARHKTPEYRAKRNARNAARRDAAVASTFGLAPETYHPVVQS